MALFARIDTRNGAIAEIRQFGESKPIPMELPHKHVRWLPVVDEKPLASESLVREGPVIKILKDRVARTWNLRKKTANEVKDINTRAFDKTHPPVMVALLHLANEIRSIKGLEPMNAEEFRSRIVELL